MDESQALQGPVEAQRNAAKANLPAHKSVLSDPSTLKPSMCTSIDGAHTITISRFGGHSLLQPNIQLPQQVFDPALATEYPQPNLSVIRQCQIYKKPETKGRRSRTSSVKPHLQTARLKLSDRGTQMTSKFDVLSNTRQPTSSLSPYVGRGGFYAHMLSRHQYEEYLQTKAKEDRWRTCVETAVQVIKDNNLMKERAKEQSAQEGGRGQRLLPPESWTPILPSENPESSVEYLNLQHLGPVDKNKMMKLENLNTMLDQMEAASSKASKSASGNSKKGLAHQSTRQLGQLANGKEVLIQENSNGRGNETSVVDIPVIAQNSSQLISTQVITPKVVLSNKVHKTAANGQQTPVARPLTDIGKLSPQHASSIEESSKYSRNGRMLATMYQSEKKGTARRSEVNVINSPAVVRNKRLHTKSPTDNEQPNELNKDIKMLTDEKRLEEELARRSKEKKSRNKEGRQITIDKIISTDLKNDTIGDSNAELDISAADQTESPDPKTTALADGAAPSQQRTMDNQKLQTMEAGPSQMTQVTSQVKFLLDRNQIKKQHGFHSNEIVTLTSHITPQAKNMQVRSKDGHNLDSQVMTMKQSNTGSSVTPIGELKSIVPTFQIQSGQLSSKCAVSPIFNGEAGVQPEALHNVRNWQSRPFKNTNRTARGTTRNQEPANASFNSSLGGQTAKNIEKELNIFENQVSFRQDWQTATARAANSKLSSKFQQPRVINMMNQQRDLSLEFMQNQMHQQNSQPPQEGKLRSMSIKKQLLRQKLLKQQEMRQVAEKVQVRSPKKRAQTRYQALILSLSPQSQLFVASSNEPVCESSNVSFNKLDPANTPGPSQTIGHSQISLMKKEQEQVGEKLPGIVSCRGPQTNQKPATPQTITSIGLHNRTIEIDQNFDKSQVSEHSPRKAPVTVLMSPTSSCRG